MTYFLKSILTRIPYLLLSLQTNYKKFKKNLASNQYLFYTYKEYFIAISPESNKYTIYFLGKKKTFGRNKMF